MIISVFVRIAEVARVKPAVFDNLVGFLLIFIIAEHDHRAFDDDFTDSVLVRLKDLRFGVADGLADAVGCRVVGRIADYDG